MPSQVHSQIPVVKAGSTTQMYDNGNGPLVNSIIVPLLLTTPRVNEPSRNLADKPLFFLALVKVEFILFILSLLVPGLECHTLPLLLSLPAVLPTSLECLVDPGRNHGCQVKHILHYCL
jgi:hypothetical protein